MSLNLRRSGIPGAVVREPVPRSPDVPGLSGAYFGGDADPISGVSVGGRSGAVPHNSAVVNGCGPEPEPQSTAMGGPSLCLARTVALIKRS